MAEQLKVFFSPALVQTLAKDLAQAAPTFRVKPFIRQATAGLDDLELLERAKHITRAMAAHLPADYPEALGVLMRSLGPEHDTDELLGVGMSPFYYLPHINFVADHGLGHFDLSLNALYELTKRFTAEWGIRSYIASDPERTFATFRRWATDINPHVRRLVSEGTRLRLPWATRVAWLDSHPTRIVELLELLKDDPTSLVRRSVANNLNDLSKAQPELVIEVCTRWLAGASPQRRALVEHALRTAVKRGEAPALKLLGFGKRPTIAIEKVTFAPKAVHIGEKVTMAFSIRNTSSRVQELLVDFVVHFVKANGATSAKIFKLKRLVLAPNAAEQLKSSVSLAVHTTRQPQPGKHAVDVRINGVDSPAGSFTVLAPEKKSAPRARG